MTRVRVDLVPVLPGLRSLDGRRALWRFLLGWRPVTVVNAAPVTFGPMPAATAVTHVAVYASAEGAEYAMGHPSGAQVLAGLERDGVLRVLRPEDDERPWRGAEIDLLVIDEVADL